MSVAQDVDIYRPLPFTKPKGLVMQYADAMQPFVKLVQANMDLMTQFTVRPDVFSQPTAFVGVMQGLMKNYTEFFTEISQSGAAMLSQGQAAFMQQTRDAASNVVDVAQAGTRRARQAA